MGENSNVIICLAREGYPSSSVYISYDYGDTYVNKTEEFKIDATKNLYASIDKFYIHPAFKTYVNVYYLIMCYIILINMLSSPKVCVHRCHKP